MIVVVFRTVRPGIVVGVEPVENNVDWRELELAGLEQDSQRIDQREKFVLDAAAVFVEERVQIDFSVFVVDLDADHRVVEIEEGRGLCPGLVEAVVHLRAFDFSFLLAK